MKPLRTLLILLMSLLLAGHAERARAQTVILHTNAALLATEHLNAGLDFTVNDWQSLGFTGIVPIMGDSWFQRMNVLGLQCDYKFWFSHKLLQSFYLGPQVGMYHYKWKGCEPGYRNTAMTAGLTGGYGWMLTRRLNLDVNYGAGYLYYHDLSDHHRFTTIHFGINLSYVF